MKKKIALFLVAALLSVGLIISCGGGGGDDPDPGKDPGGKDPEVPAGTTVTVKFDPNGGTIGGLAEVKEVMVKSGDAVSRSNWPEDPEKSANFLGGIDYNDKFVGWFEDGTNTEYTPAVTKITKDVTLKAKYDPFTWPTPTLDFASFTPLGEFTVNNNPKAAAPGAGVNRQRGWVFNGTGGDGDGIDYTFTDDTWLLLETTTGNTGGPLSANGNGFGGLQVTFIKSFDPEAGKQESSVLPGWTGYNKENGEIFYFAIKMSKLKGYAEFTEALDGEGANAGDYILYLGYYNDFDELGFLNAYLTDDDLDKVSAEGHDVMAITNSSVNYGFIISDRDEIDWAKLFDTTFYPVESIAYTGDAVAFASVPVTLDVAFTPGNASVKRITWEVTSGSASVTDGVLTATAAGKITLKATITNGKYESDGTTKTDFEQTLTNAIEILALPDFGTNTEFVGKAAPIGFGGYDGDLGYDDLFKTSKFIVFAFLGSNTTKDGEPHPDGLGGVQLVIQDNKAYGWNQSNSGDWCSVSGLAADKVVYLVADMSKLDGYSTIIADTGITGAKFVLNSGFGYNYLGAWLTKETLDTTEFASYGDASAFYGTLELGIEE
jgi:hypothetical protein